MITIAIKVKRYYGIYEPDVGEWQFEITRAMSEDLHVCAVSGPETADIPRLLGISWLKYSLMAKHKFGAREHFKFKNMIFKTKEDAKSFLENYLEPIICSLVLVGEIQYKGEELK
jgi:hypothetical protein